ncbi:hypothetical protein [Desulfosporosinus sp. OT]|uniref:hypothetical protein n=1 Tax=Desulfosporosinus sp. OT TaxID=913865 RepID=UPI000223A389|nr:hypothetical protein [Desulfosporosinus sp. OT]EGW36482.1 hypothetical protein DOT_5646 [Desulfosporosinus sp. OT]
MYLEIVSEDARIVSDVLEELKRAMSKKPLFTCPHHGYAIILEEMDELWDEVKKKKFERDIKNMRSEAVQVAAMAIKFIMSMENDWKPISQNKRSERDFTEEELQNEIKCKQCRYSFMTEDALAELGSDPCDICHDLSGWKPKE